MTPENEHRYNQIMVPGTAMAMASYLEGDRAVAKIELFSAFKDVGETDKMALFHAAFVVAMWDFCVKAEGTMYDVKVKMRDGREFTAPLMNWRPQDGYFTLASCSSDIPGKIKFSEVESAHQLDVHISKNEKKDIDLIKRARNHGWKG